MAVAQTKEDEPLASERGPAVPGAAQSDYQRRV